MRIALALPESPAHAQPVAMLSMRPWLLGRSLAAILS
jgi:hypothetical protein